MHDQSQALCMLCCSLPFGSNSCGVEVVLAGFKGSQVCQMLSKATCWA